MFKDMVEGIKDFAKTTGVEAIKLPTGEEAAEIKREIEALPPTAGTVFSTADLQANTALTEILRTWWHQPFSQPQQSPVPRWLNLGQENIPSLPKEP